jgi:acyl-CoA thioester hydrolase
VNERESPPRRGDFPGFTHFQTTRWADNDSYGHVNNVVYYSLIDSAVNQHLIEQGVLNIVNSPSIGLVLETSCHYFSPVSFPDVVTVGLKVAHLGNSSVRYEVGLFRNDEDTACARAHFVHVYVDRQTRRSVRIPDDVRQVLTRLIPDRATAGPWSAV